MPLFILSPKLIRIPKMSVPDCVLSMEDSQLIFFPPGISYTLYLLVIKNICMILPFVKGCVDIFPQQTIMYLTVLEKKWKLLCVPFYYIARKLVRSTLSSVNVVLPCSSINVRNFEVAFVSHS